MTNPKTVTEFLESEQDYFAMTIGDIHDYRRLLIVFELARHSVELYRELRNVDHYPLLNCVDDEGNWGNYFPDEKNAQLARKHWPTKKPYPKLRGNNETNNFQR